MAIAIFLIACVVSLGFGVAIGVPLGRATGITVGRERERRLQRAARLRENERP